MNNLHREWKQGYFIDNPRYKRWTPEEKKRADDMEKCVVRPFPTGNSICQCRTPEEAKWIAQRLNLASILEQMTYDFATGKTDGSEIVRLVMENCYGK